MIDWAVSASSSSDRERLNQTEGRMRLCSRSIVFEPRHSLKGIVRIPFRYMTGCPSLVEEVSGVDGRDSSVFLTFSSSRHFVVKANNAIGPYEQIQSPTDFRLDFLHSSPSNVASLTKQLFESEKTSVRFDPSIEKQHGNVETVLPTLTDKNNLLQELLNPPNEIPLNAIHFLK